MRYIFFWVVLLSFNVNAQTTLNVPAEDTIAPYKRTAIIPTFSIQQPDSSWLNNTNLSDKKPTLIFYFSPDCGHCQMETEEILSKIKQLPNLQIIMVTSRPFEDMVRFADHYKINRFSTIKIGYDPSRKITRFFDVKFTPFSALYDRKGKLVKAYEQAIDMEELITLSK